MWKPGQLYFFRDFTGDCYVGAYVRHDDELIIFDQLCWLQQVGRRSIIFGAASKGTTEQQRCEQFPAHLEGSWPRAAICAVLWPHDRPPTQ